MLHTWFSKIVFFARLEAAENTYTTIICLCDIRSYLGLRNIHQTLSPIRQSNDEWLNRISTTWKDKDTIDLGKAVQTEYNRPLRLHERRESEMKMLDDNQDPFPETATRSLHQLEVNRFNDREKLDNRSWDEKDSNQDELAFEETVLANASDGAELIRDLKEKIVELEEQIVATHNARAKKAASA
ncbi:MAG: hypothetical protein Q9218_007270 [Villophora microphyllina]